MRKFRTTRKSIDFWFQDLPLEREAFLGVKNKVAAFIKLEKGGRMNVIQFLINTKRSSTPQFFSLLSTTDLRRLASLLNLDLPSQNRITVLPFVYRNIQARKEVLNERKRSS